MGLFKRNRVECSKCGTSLKIFKAKNSIVFSKPGAMKGKAIICNKCDKIMCSDCTGENYGISSCYSCNGSLSLYEG